MTNEQIAQKAARVVGTLGLPGPEMAEGHIAKVTTIIVSAINEAQGPLVKERDDLKYDQGQWRKGVALIAGATGEKNPPNLSCVRIAERVLEIAAAKEKLESAQAQDDKGLAEFIVDELRGEDYATYVNDFGDTYNAIVDESKLTMLITAAIAAYRKSKEEKC